VTNQVTTSPVHTGEHWRGCETRSPATSSACPCRRDRPQWPRGRGGVSPDGKLLATVGDNGMVRLWNPATGDPVGVPIHATSTFDGVKGGWRSAPTATCWPAPPSRGTVELTEVSPFAHPYAALCADVGPPTKQDWNKYAPGEPQPKICA